MAATPETAQETTPALTEGAAAQKEAEQLAQDTVLFRKNASGTAMPSADIVIGRAGIDDLMAQRFLARVDKSDLLLTSAPNPLFEQKDASGRDLPIYVIVGHDSDLTDTPKAELMKTRENDPYILINEKYHKWTEAYAKENFLGSDALFDDPKNALKPDVFLEQLYHEKVEPAHFINRLVKAFEFKATKKRLDTILSSAEHDAREMEVGTPNIRIINTPAIIDSAAAGFSSEGNGYIFFDGSDLKSALASGRGTKDLKGVIGHETTHLDDGKNGQALADLVADHNSPADFSALKAIESRADLTGAGPLESNDPKAFIDFFKTTLKDNYVADHPHHKHPKEADLKAESEAMAANDPTHPSILERINALTKEAALMKEYEAAHKVTTHEERKAESGWLVEQVLDNKTIAPLASKGGSASPPGPLTPDQESRISIVKDTLAKVFPSQDVTSNSAPLSSSAAAQPQVIERK